MIYIYSSCIVESRVQRYNMLKNIYLQNKSQKTLPFKLLGEIWEF